MALTQEFWQITLPLMTTGILAMLGTMTTIIVTASSASKRMDDLRSDMNRQFGIVNTRLERIEDKLDNHETRITVLEERTSPVRR